MMNLSLWLLVAGCYFGFCAILIFFISKVMYHDENLQSEADSVSSWIDNERKRLDRRDHWGEPAPGQGSNAFDKEPR